MSKVSLQWGPFDPATALPPHSADPEPLSDACCREQGLLSGAAAGCIGSQSPNHFKQQGLSVVAQDAHAFTVRTGRGFPMEMNI